MRTLVLIDSQDLYHLARRAWASESASTYAWPGYDVEKLPHPPGFQDARSLHRGRVNAEGQEKGEADSLALLLRESHFTSVLK